MNIKKNIITLSLGAFIMFANSANASKLPKDVFSFVRAQLPQIQQRFDSVLIVNENVMYIPLTPPAISEVDDIKIEYVYPENKTLKDLPEVVLLEKMIQL